jgi:hypothetical protein
LSTARRAASRRAAFAISRFGVRRHPGDQRGQQVDEAPDLRFGGFAGLDHLAAAGVEVGVGVEGGHGLGSGLGVVSLIPTCPEPGLNVL